MKNYRALTKITLLTSLVTALVSGAPAQAQVWGYSPYTGSSTWLSLARTLSYPLNRISGARTPFYLANNLIYSATYGAQQGLFGKRRDLYYGTYNDPEPYGDPRQRVRPYNNGQGVADQMVHARWSKSQQQDPDEQDDVPVPVAANPTDSTWINNPIVTPQVVPSGAGEMMPPVAPPRALTPPAAAQHASEPLAAGFVRAINERFGGNIAAALADKDTRKYARAVGLIDSDKTAADKMPQDKVDLIRAILADQAEAASVKINAVRVLLKH